MSIQIFSATHAAKRARRNILRGSAFSFAFVCVAAIAADQGSGSIVLSKKTAAIQHAALVRGPNEMDPSHSILRLYLSTTDMSDKIKACKTLSCADQSLADGATVDFGDARHLAYWVRVNGGLAQYSGGTDASAFALTTNTPDHLAGKLHIDDTAMGGAKIEANFDLTLINTFKTVR
ncbi:MAG TPA: hypothetical protein VGO25_14705 [Rhodanobacteraceae bacterium]|jgi:hypothetical protein|nr:hypothetical protein [Rhodanobacteraceae bacterium]